MSSTMRHLEGSALQASQLSLTWPSVHLVVQVVQTSSSSSASGWGSTASTFATLPLQQVPTSLLFAQTSQSALGSCISQRSLQLQVLVSAFGSSLVAPVAFSLFSAFPVPLFAAALPFSALFASAFSLGVPSAGAAVPLVAPVASAVSCSVCTVWAGSVPPVAGSAKAPTGHRLNSIQTVSSIAIHLFMFYSPLFNLQNMFL